MNNSKKGLIIGIIIAIVLIAAIIIALNFNSNKNEQTSELKTIKVNEVTRSIFYAPQYVAIEKGFFEEEGIKVDLTTAQGTDKVTTAVLANQSEIGFGGPEGAIYVYNEGKEDYLEVFAQMTKRDGSFLVARTDTDNFSFNDLKGKTIIPGRRGGMPFMTFEYVLKQAGLDTTNDLVLDDSIKFDLLAGAFAGGNADYVTLFEPTASMTQATGKGYIVASIGEVSGAIPYTGYYAKKSYIEQNSETIQGFTNATAKGLKWVAENNEEEITKVIKDYFPGTDEEMIKQSVKRYKEIDAWKTDPVLEEEDFNRLQTVMEEAGELTKKAPYDKVINNSFAKKVIE